MEELANSIYQYSVVYQVWDWIELLIGIFFCFTFSHWKREKIWIVCTYVGIIFGSFAGFVITYDWVGFFLGILFGILVILSVVNLCPRGEILLLSFFVTLKLIMIGGVYVTYYAYATEFGYESVAEELLGWAILLSCVAVCVRMICTARKKVERYVWLGLCGVFGILQVAGAIISLEGQPLSYVTKFMSDDSEVLNYFLCLWKMDYTIADDHWKYAVAIPAVALIQGVVLIVKWQKKIIERKQDETRE